MLVTHRTRRPRFVCVTLRSSRIPYLAGTFLIKWADGVNLVDRPATHPTEEHVEAALRCFFHRHAIIVVAYRGIY